jgi:hydrogenase maturation protease
MTAMKRDVGSRTVMVIGVGNRYRSDDAAGLEAVRRIVGAAPNGAEVVELEGEPTSLLDAWGDAETVYIVDAVSSGGEPGTVYRFDARNEPPPAPFRHRGTHAFSVADVVELARALDLLPRRLIAYGIEGSAFRAGVELSPEAERGVRETADRLLSELRDPAERSP